MIPKIIHACWLGQAKMPEEQVKYIEGWKKLNPDYDVRIWTDETFSKYYDNSEFVKDCIKKKKYGFLSDFFRFVVLYEFGGIYVDTDVEMFKCFDPFLNCKMFIGFIYDSLIGTATFGTEAKNPLMLEWLNKLENDYLEKGEFTISNNWITKYFLDNFDDFKLNGKRQSLKCGIEVFPKDYFERYKISNKSNGGYSEHHCYGSWNDEKLPKYKKICNKLIPRKILSYFGHKKAIKNTPYYERYKRDIKE